MSTDLVAYHAKAHPKNLAAIDIASGRRWSYSHLHDDINRAAAALSAQGVQEGDRVAALAANSIFVVILQQAIMRRGAIFVPLNWRLSAAEIGSLVKDCSPKLLFWDATLDLTWRDFEQHIPEDLRRLDLQDLIAKLDNPSISSGILPVQQDKLRAASARLPNRTAAIIYTSGTSGRPKGVKVTTHNMLGCAINYAVLGDVDPTSVLLCDTPLFHIIGLVLSVWSPFLRGATVVMSPRFDAASTNERLSSNVIGGANGGRIMVTHYFCVPQMADSLSRAANFDPAKWTDLKAIFTGGAPNPPERIHWWLDRGVNMVNGYGATEAGHFFGMPIDEDVTRQKAGSVGLAGPMTDVEIVNPETGEPVPTGEPGEIVASGLSVTSGYWGHASQDGCFEVVKDVTGRGREVQWYRTGDIARQDEDGFVYIIGRRKDIFITGGESVAPSDVEMALTQHPQVAEAAVIGVSDPTWGEVGCAWILLEKTTQKSEPCVSQEDLVAHCQRLIGKYKIPKHFRFVETLPRTGSGKIMKHLLKKQLEQERL